MYFIVSSLCCVFFFFKQKTAYEMRISDWSSDVCSSDLFERGDVHFLDIGEVRDRALRCRHILGDLAAHTDDLDRLVGARAAGAGGVIALPAAVAQESVEIGGADAVALGVDLAQVDDDVLGAGTDGGGSENRSSRE